MHSYRLRPASDSDTPMLLAIYTSTRQEEVAQTGWPQGQQDAFLAMQAKAQHEHYLLHYPEAERHLIESQVLAALRARARRAGKPLTIHVETNNPARRLYERLGFVEQADKGVYLLMRWQPDD